MVIRDSKTFKYSSDGRIRYGSRSLLLLEGSVSKRGDSLLFEVVAEVHPHLLPLVFVFLKILLQVPKRDRRRKTKSGTHQDPSSMTDVSRDPFPTRVNNYPDGLPSVETFVRNKCTRLPKLCGVYTSLRFTTVLVFSHTRDLNK